MATIYKMLILQSQNEHVFEYVSEHDLSVKKNFSNPKIYTAKGDISKRWYVYFSFRNPETGKLERQQNIYGNVNKLSVKEDRLTVLSSYRKNLLRLLKEGYSPYEDIYEDVEQPFIVATNEVHVATLVAKTSPKISVGCTEVALCCNNVATEKPNNAPENEVIAEGCNIVATKLQPKASKSTQTVATKIATEEQPGMTVRQAFEYGLRLKEKLIRNTTRRGYVNKVANFVDWVEKNHKHIKSVEQLTKKEGAQFLNEILDRTSARNRNNYRLELGSIMQALEDNDLVPVNFFKKFPVLKSTPERNKTYTKEVQQEIFKYLETEDPILLLFIKFVSYNFLRPIEVCRLKVGDINLKERTLSFKAKNSPLKTKIIPELLINELPDLSNLNKNHALFTPDTIGGEWDATDDNRRDHFSKRYKTVVKEHFNLGHDYGLYSFRHTFITKLYRQLRKKASPFEAKSNLMLITGHATMASLEKYLRDIDAELPMDYSALLK